MMKEFTETPRFDRQTVIYIRILAVLAVLYTAYFAAPVLIPFVIAVMLTLALAPLVRVLAKCGVPERLGAAAVLLIGVASLSGVLVALSTPASEWLSQAPEKLRTIKPHIAVFQAPIQKVKEAGEDVGDLGILPAENKTVNKVTKVQVVPPDFIDVAVSATPSAIAAFLSVLFFVYFLLSSGPQVRSKLVRILEFRVPEESIADLAHQAQREMSRYLLTVSSVNFVLGALTALWLWYFRLPDPLLWGVIVMMLNFAPYVGAVISVAILLTVALIEFDSLAKASLITSGFCLLTVLEGQLLTPLILGRRLALSPYIVFLGIIFWGVVVGNTWCVNGSSADGVLENRLRANS